MSSPLSSQGGAGASLSGKGGSAAADGCSVSESDDGQRPRQLYDVEGDDEEELLGGGEGGGAGGGDGGGDGGGSSESNRILLAS